MIIVGDIGNTETKICLVTSNKKIIKKINLDTNKINSKLLNKSLSKLIFVNKNNIKCLFCSVVPKSFNEIKKFFKKKFNIKCYELKTLNLKQLINI